MKALWIKRGNGLENSFRLSEKRNLANRLRTCVVAAALLHTPLTAFSTDPPTLSVSADATIEGERMKVTVTLDTTAANEVTGVLFTRDETAMQGLDYYGATFPISIPAGERDAVVWIDTLRDGKAEGNESFWLNLVRAKGAEIASMRTRATILDRTDGATNFSIDEIRVKENSGRVDVIVRRTGSIDATDSVRLFTRPDSARPRVDFFGFSRDISFRPGETVVRTGLDIVDDSIPESQERLQLLLKKGRSIAASSFLTIVDDDENGTYVPRLTLNGKIVSESDGRVDIDIRMNDISNDDVTLTVFSQDVSAQRGQDYYGFTRNVTIPAGSTAASFSVDILDDNMVEAEEQFALRLTGVTGAIASQRTAVITIVDDDGNTDLPEIRETFTTDVFENDGIATFQLELSRASSQRISVDVETIEIDRSFPGFYALSPEDYLDNSATVIFEPGETTAEFTVEIIDDNTQENQESLNIELSNPVNATIADRSRNPVLFIIDDEPPMLPVVQLSSSVVSENEGSIIIDVLRPEIRFDLPAPIATIDIIEDTAFEGRDYIPLSNPVRVVLPDEEGGQTVFLAELIDNAIDEPVSKRINLVISEVEDGLAGGEATIIILDDEGTPEQPFVFVEIPHVTEVSLSKRVRVSLSKPSSEPVHVSLATQDDTAVAGEDYISVTTTVTFSPGETSKYIVIPILEDTVDEAPLERLNINVTNVQGATIGSNGGLFIRDNDL